MFSSTLDSVCESSADVASSISNTSDFLEEIANSMNILLIGEYGNLCTIYDKNNNKEYVSVTTTNYGYFVLLEDDKIALLNRDKEE